MAVDPETSRLKEALGFCFLCNFMEHFVYIIYSTKYDKYYRGYSIDPQKRLIQHNKGESRYTKEFLPWELVYVEKLPTKRDALIREKALKKYAKNQIRELIKSSKNILYQSFF